MARCSDFYRTYGGSRGNRLRSSCYIGGLPIHVSIGTYGNRRCFTDDLLSGSILAVFSTHPSTLAVCLMPDHAHWLIEGVEAWQEEVRRLKSLTTARAWRAGHKGRLWQRSFWDRVVRSEEDLAGVARYLISNPVRAGLVSRVGDYPYQYCRWKLDA